MSKYQKFDKPACNHLRHELEDHLRSFLEERGLTMDLGNAKFNDGMVRFINVTFTIPEVTQAHAEKMLRTRLELHGIIQRGAEVSLEGYEYLLVGYNHKAPVKPWEVVKIADGTRWRMSDAQLKEHFTFL